MSNKKPLTKKQKDLIRTYLSVSYHPDSFGERLTENQMIVRATRLIDACITAEDPRTELMQEITGISLTPPKDHTSAKTLFGDHHE
jgi:hypothetical protein